MSDDTQTPKGVDEIRSEVIEKYELDEETQTELIDKITNDTLEAQKKLGTAIKQKVEWREKAEAGSQNKDAEKPDGEANKPKPSTEPDETSIRLERLEIQSQGYSKDEVDEIMSFGGLKALENETFKAGITAKREQREAEEAVSGSSSGSSSVSKKYTPEQLKAMPLEKMEEEIMKGNVEA